MAITTQDVITEDFVRETVDDVVEEALVYREVFNEINATNISSNTYTFHIESSSMGTPEIVGEGEEAPRHESETEPVTVEFDKYLGEVSISMEAVSDGIVDMKARDVENLARAMAERLNEDAYSVISDSAITTDESGDDIGEGGSSLTFNDISQGMKAMREQGYTPDTLVVDTDGYFDLLNDSNFNRATESGDEVVRTGEIGRIMGMPVMVDSTQSISGGHGAFIVDSTKFGYELTRTPMSTNRYEEPERQVDVIQAFTRKAFVSIRDDAAAIIDG